MSKYRAQRTVVDNITFHSKKEAARYLELKTLFSAGKIFNLELQPKFKLHAFGGGLIGKYIADFAYFEGERPERERVVEDVKGFRTAFYRWKKKHTELEYKVSIREV